MAQLCTHLHVAKRVLEREGDLLAKEYFLLGAAAPELYDRSDEESYREVHFYTGNQIDLEKFRVNTDYMKREKKWFSFFFGYYMHLWLDAYISEHGSVIVPPGKKGLSDEEFKEAFTENIEIYDMRQICEYLKTVDFGGVHDEEVPTLEFISLKDAFELIKACRYGEDQYPQITVIEEDVYLDFIEKTVEKFFK